MGSQDQTDQDDAQQELDDTTESLVNEAVDEDVVPSEVEEGVDLKTELDNAKASAEENWNNLLMAKADVENIRRRTQKDIEKAHRFSIEKFAKDLLPVVDSIEMGMTAAGSTSEDVTSIREGMELTYKQLLASLEKSNVTQVDPLNESFNPEHHQAISMVPTADYEPNTVIEVFQKGYLLNGRLIRPAMVIVSQALPSKGSEKRDD